MIIKNKSVLLFLSFLVLFFACNKESTEPTGNPETLIVSEISYSDCLNKNANKDPKFECVEYSVVNGNYLKLVRTNVCFNCCYDTIDITVEELENNKILITERESGNPCNCNCIYNIDYIVGPFDYSDYEITIDENYWEPMIFNISFTENVQDSYCEERTGYPWDM